MTNEEFKIFIKKVNPTFKAQKAAGMPLNFNAWLIEIYKAESGAKIFQSYRTWLEQGYQVKKGSKSYAVFSRPVGVIKAERGKEASEGDMSFFRTAHLFNELQVEPINQGATAPSQPAELHEYLEPEAGTQFAHQLIEA